MSKPLRHYQEDFCIIIHDPRDDHYAYFYEGRHVVTEYQNKQVWGNNFSPDFVLTQENLDEHSIFTDDEKYRSRLETFKRSIDRS